MSTGDGAGSEDDGGAAQTAETRSWSQRGAGHESLGREEEEKDNSVWAQPLQRQQQQQHCLGIITCVPGWQSSNLWPQTTTHYLEF
ncbi:hypothetical protein TYRP_008246 [Tyrophagus putrescentiae]|nr:hypothetical protein TYRP_008246 [Tyrophagus putrescentiae]